MLAISACWVAYAFGSAYVAGRAGGMGKVGCVIMAAIFGWLDVLLMIFGTSSS